MNKIKSIVFMFIILINGGAATVALSQNNEKETYCLAQNIFFEARGESTKGQLMVAAVTINRANHKSFPNTICGAVWQRKQFSWTHDGKHDNPERMGKTDRLEWAKIKHLADLVLNQPNHVLPKTQALYYHADYVKPFWIKHKAYLGKVGTHLFYKNKER
jgi:N-acetylmuramoyl-L-alanine amidase